MKVTAIHHPIINEIKQSTILDEETKTILIRDIREALSNPELKKLHEKYFGIMIKRYQYTDMNKLSNKLSRMFEWALTKHAHTWSSAYVDLTIAHS